MKDIPPEKLDPLSHIFGIPIVYGNTIAGHEDLSPDSDCEEEDSQMHVSDGDDGGKGKRTPTRKAVDYTALMKEAAETTINIDDPKEATEDGPSLAQVSEMIQKKTKFEFPTTPSLKLIGSGL